MFKLISKPTALAAAALALSLPALAQSQTPAISLHVDESVMMGESFLMNVTSLQTTTLEVDAGAGRQSFKVEPTRYDSSTGEFTTTLIRVPVSSGDIRIYGDGSLIDYLDASQMYITSISMPTLTNLEILNLEHNQLGSLDLSAFSKLQSLSLSDNPFDVSPLKIGGNKPDLQILEISMIEGSMSEDFNLSDYPKMQSVIAYSNRGLNSIDPTGCPILKQLSIDSCNVSHLDISKNPLLRILNISDTRITDIDLSSAPELREFYAQHMSGTINPDIKLQNIDLTHNPELVYLYINGNDLTELDLSKNTKIQMLNISHNRLPGVDFSNMTQMIEPNISFNNMCYATMPLPDENWNDYIWMQNDWKVNKSYPVNGTIDFSESMLLPGTVTSLMLMKDNPEDSQNPIMLTPGTDFDFNAETGILTLKTLQSDSIYAQIVNSAFLPTSETPWINTTKFVVKSQEEYGKPIVRSTFNGFSTGEQVALHIGAAGATPENPRKVLIDFGSGNEADLREFTITTSELPEQANVTGTCTGYQIRVCADENVDITALGLHHTLYSIDVNKMDQLRYLDLENCGLYSAPDLKYNKYLRYLNLAGNNLYTINLDGTSDGDNKIHLADINISRNHLSEFAVRDNRTLVNLNIADNQIEEISFKDADNLKNLDISGNNLSRLDIHYSYGIQNLDASGNNLTEISFPETISPVSVDLSDNEFQMNTLPAPSTFGNALYTYAPQGMIPLPAKGPGANLSSQNVTVDGKKTSFAWYKADGSQLTAGTDYTISGGNTRFLNTSVGNVYCQITNPAFPELTLRTSEIEAAGMPTHKLAEFTTPTGGQQVGLSLAALSGTPAIYFDWKGDGDLVQYLLKDTYTLFDAQTTAGAKVKVYVYDENDRIGVFSMDGATLTDLDASGLVDAFCLSINNAGLSEAIFPENANMQELKLDGNSFSDMTQIPFDKWTNLRTLSLNNNQFTSFDASSFKSLQALSIGYNNLRSITLGNPQLFFLNLSGNEFRSFSYETAQVPQLEQLALSQNYLESVEIPENAAALKAITLDHNLFNFATLPLKRDNWIIYSYHAQAQAEPTSNKDGKVDFSFTDKAKDGTQTVYTWYVGEIEMTGGGVPVVDDNGEIVGEKLDVEQYSVEDGVTTFLGNYPELTCVMTNPALPNLQLVSIPVSVSLGIDDVVSPEDIRLTVNGNSLTVTAPADFEAALYGINGMLAGKAQLTDGTATFGNLASGVYILATPAGAYRILVK